ASASLRAQRNRALNKGVRVEEVEPARERAPELRACHAAWLGTKRLPRLHFVAHADLAIAGDGPLADHRLFVASSAADQDQVLGYLTLAPVPRRRGWLVEKIVRHPRAPNGTAELLVDQALRSVALSSERFTL